MTTRETLHKLIDELPEDEIQAATLYLQHLRNRNDPVLAALLNAPEDDEPESDYERDAVAEGMEDLAAGRVVSSAEILDDFQ